MKRTIWYEGQSHKDRLQGCYISPQIVTSEFKIKNAQRNKLSDKDQRRVANAIKIARFMALMPYTL